MPHDPIGPILATKAAKAKLAAAILTATIAGVTFTDFAKLLQEKPQPAAPGVTKGEVAKPATPTATPAPGQTIERPAGPAPGQTIERPAVKDAAKPARADTARVDTRTSSGRSRGIVRPLEELIEVGDVGEPRRTNGSRGGGGGSSGGGGGSSGGGGGGPSGGGGSYGGDPYDRGTSGGGAASGGETAPIATTGGASPTGPSVERHPRGSYGSSPLPRIDRPPAPSVGTAPSAPGTVIAASPTSAGGALELPPLGETSPAPKKTEKPLEPRVPAGLDKAVLGLDEPKDPYSNSGRTLSPSLGGGVPSSRVSPAGDAVSEPASSSSPASTASPGRPGSSGGARGETPVEATSPATKRTRAADAAETDERALGLSGAALVATEDGPRALESLGEDDRVLVTEGTPWKTRPATILRVKKRDATSVVELSLAPAIRDAEAKDGTEAPRLRCAPDQLLLVRGKGPRAASRLKAGDWLVGARGEPIEVRAVEEREEKTSGFVLELDAPGTIQVAAGEGAPFVQVGVEKGKAKKAKPGAGPRAKPRDEAREEDRPVDDEPGLPLPPQAAEEEEEPALPGS